MFSLPSTHSREELGRLLGDRAEPDQVLERERVAGELADRERGPAERERRDDRVDAAAVGQARVDHRRGLVDAPADLRDDPVDDPQQVGVVEERRLGLLDPAVPLDVDLVGAVDHHLGDARVVQERLERPVAEDVVGDLPLEVGAVARAERSLLGVQLLGDDHAHAESQLVAALEVEERAAEPGDARPVDLRLQLGVRIAGALRHRADSTRSRSASIELSLPAKPLRSTAHRRPRRGSDAAVVPVVARRFLSLLGAADAGKTDGSSRLERACERTVLVGRPRREGAVDGGRNRRVVGQLVRHLRVEGELDVGDVDAAGGADAVRDQRDALALEAEPVDRLEADADVLERRHLGIADEEQLVAVVERREHRAVEQRAGVDHDRLVRVSCCGEDGRELGRADHVGLLRAARRGQHGEPVRGSV